MFRVLWNDFSCMGVVLCSETDFLLACTHLIRHSRKIEHPTFLRFRFLPLFLFYLDNLEIVQHKQEVCHRNENTTYVCNCGLYLLKKLPRPLPLHVIARPRTVPLPRPRPLPLPLVRLCPPSSMSIASRFPG